MRSFAAVSLALLLAPLPAAAETKTWAIGSFDKVRVDGPFEVRLVTGASPRASAEADPRALDRMDIALQGSTLVVRAGLNGWGERDAGAPLRAPVVTLSTPNLNAANVNAGGRLTITGMKGQRLDVSVNGAGALAIDGVEADELNAILVGPGTLTLGGRAQRAKLLSSGSGSTDATGLDVKDLIVRLDGVGMTKAAARYTAQVTSTGLGAVSIEGSPVCTVKALAGGPVSCGAGD